MKAISDEVLSIVREMVERNTATTALPSNAVKAMINRIDYQDKLLDAYRAFAGLYDEWLCSDGAVGIRHASEVAGTRQIVADLEKRENKRC
ncbi:hypothetical protein [Bilophila wadsworthia]|uniref:hypothetical protein n=1 Tax=Bilophila wadsworthia TaxID=35833 RepID=UPI00266FA233|nr:hypothetical protein [Bilophila wadsworthia]